MNRNLKKKKNACFSALNSCIEKGSIYSISWMQEVVIKDYLDHHPWFRSLWLFISSNLQTFTHKQDWEHRINNTLEAYNKVETAWYTYVKTHTWRWSKKEKAERHYYTCMFYNSVKWWRRTTFRNRQKLEIIMIQKPTFI